MRNAECRVLYVLPMLLDAAAQDRRRDPEVISGAAATGAAILVCT